MKYKNKFTNHNNAWQKICLILSNVIQMGFRVDDMVRFFPRKP